MSDGCFRSRSQNPRCKRIGDFLCLLWPICLPGFFCKSLSPGEFPGHIGNFGVGVIKGKFKEGAVLFRVQVFEDAGGLDADVGIRIGETKSEPVGGFVAGVVELGL